MGVDRVGAAGQDLPADARCWIGVEIADQPNACVIAQQLG